MWFGQTGLNVNRFETGLSASVNGAYMPLFAGRNKWSSQSGFHDHFLAQLMDVVCVKHVL